MYLEALNPNLNFVTRKTGTVKENTKKNDNFENGLKNCNFVSLGANFDRTSCNL